MTGIAASTMTTFFRNVSALSRHSIAIAAAATLRMITARSIGRAHGPAFTGPISLRTIFLPPAFVRSAFAKRGGLRARSTRAVSVGTAFAMTVLGGTLLALGARMLRSALTTMRMVLVVSLWTIAIRTL